MWTDLTATRMRAAIAVTVALCAVFPAQVHAAGSVISALPPESCALTLTVQAQSCLTTRYWTCPGDGAGTLWSGVTIGGVEAEVTMLDQAGNPAKTRYIEEEATVVQANVADPMDMAALVETGTDAFDYVRRRDDGGADERYVGDASMMGRVSTIDGYDLAQVYLSYEVFRDGVSIWQGSALQYLAPDQNALIYGIDYDAAGAALTDYRPLRLLFPGQEAANPSCEG